MYIYNVTIKLDHSIHAEWVQWMQEKHIPEVMASGCFTGHKFVRLLDIDEVEGVTYAAQYFAETREDYDRYIAIFAPALRDDSMKQWGNKFIGFRTLMKEV